MQLKDQVCNPKLSKKLKELGVEQDSIFTWTGEEGDYYIRQSPRLMYESAGMSQTIGEVLSAFTVAELGEMLPDYLGVVFNKSWLTCVKVGLWEVGYPEKEKSFEANTEADARAKLLIYLLENNLVSND